MSGYTESYPLIWTDAEYVPKYVYSIEERGVNLIPRRSSFHR